MVEVGFMMSMVFIKDPEQNASNVIIKGIYWDSIWVEHTQTGVNEILNISDVAFNNPVKDNPPERSFIVKDATDTWMYWNHEEGFWHECNDPTQPECREASEDEIPSSTSVSRKTIH